MQNELRLNAYPNYVMYSEYGEAQMVVNTSTGNKYELLAGVGYPDHSNPTFSDLYMVFACIPKDDYYELKYIDYTVGASLLIDRDPDAIDWVLEWVFEIIKKYEEAL